MHTWTLPLECGCVKSKDPTRVPDGQCDEKGYCECPSMNGNDFAYTDGAGCRKQSKLQYQY